MRSDHQNLLGAWVAAERSTDLSKHVDGGSGAHSIGGRAVTTFALVGVLVSAKLAVTSRWRGTTDK